MRNLHMLVIMFSCLGTTGISHTVDVSTLSEYEKKVHRVGWCIQSLNLTSFDNDLDPFFMGLFENTGEIHDLLKRNGFFERDQNNIHQKAQDDMQVKFLSGDVDYTNQYVDECNADMLAILKEEYVPNFSYMGK